MSLLNIVLIIKNLALLTFVIAVEKFNWFLSCIILNHTSNLTSACCTLTSNCNIILIICWIICSSVTYYIFLLKITSCEPKLSKASLQNDLLLIIFYYLIILFYHAKLQHSFGDDLWRPGIFFSSTWIVRPLQSFHPIMWLLCVKGVGNKGSPSSSLSLWVVVYGIFFVWNTLGYSI